MEEKVMNIWIKSSILNESQPNPLHREGVKYVQSIQMAHRQFSFNLYT